MTWQTPDSRIYQHANFYYRCGKSKNQRAFRHVHGAARYAVGVDHGGSDFRMAEQFLDGTYIIICLQNGSGKRMAKCVGGVFFRFSPITLILYRKKPVYSTADGGSIFNAD
jgi:hypothetical protein